MAGSLIELARYRYDCGIEALEDARLMYENGRYKNALNRAYYAVFHGMRAVNALDSFDSSKHSGVIAHFNRFYVKTGVFDKEASRLIRLTSENRERADYLDFFVASREEAEDQIQRAERFLGWIKDYLTVRSVL